MKNKKNILVLGATSGIGFSISTKLSAPETTIYATGRNKRKLRELKNKIHVIGGTCKTYILDLSELRNLNRLRDTICYSNIQFDWIVYCSGHIEKVESDKLVEGDKLDQTFKLNILAPVELIRTFEDKLKEDGGVIFISSTSGIWGNGDYPIYSATKSALINFGKSIAKRWNNKKKSIVVCPGPTNTSMREEIRGDAKKHQEPEDVAAVVVTIIESPSKYCSGDVIVVREGKSFLVPQINF